MKLVIDRTKWLRGQGNGSLLKPSSGQMCCLGFHAIACGFTSEQITGVGRPTGIALRSTISYEEVVAHYKAFNQEWVLCDYLSPTAEAQANNGYVAASINDDKKISDAAREAELIELFGRNGVELSFIN